jgi:N-acetylglutamate synthase
MNTITQVEELGLNAWQPLQTLMYDGWVLRFANGYTKRANSVNPIYESQLKVADKIEQCERLYRARKLDVVFKMTGMTQPVNLDKQLEARGYRHDSLTSVQLADLIGVDARVDNSIVFTQSLTDAWLTDFMRLSNVNANRQATLKQMLSGSPLLNGFFALRRDEQTIACGLGVVQNEFVGLFDIVTDANFRNQGHGQQLVKNILAWGKANGARTAYLQVMLNNPPALRLYAKLGFKEIYQYWYRIKA